MGASKSFLQVATLANALLWPLAAGAAIVVWSKVRAAAQARRVAAIEAQMRDAYRTLETQPAPPELTGVLDALEEGEALAPHASAQPKRETPADS